MRGCFSAFGERSQLDIRTLQFSTPRARLLTKVEAANSTIWKRNLRCSVAFAPEVKHRENALPFNHPPFEALLFVPLAGLPYLTAYLVWAVFNVALIVGFWTLLRPRLPSLHNLLPSLPLLGMFAFFP